MGNIFSGYIKLTAPLKESVGKSVGVDKKTTDTSNDFLTGIADSIFGGDSSLNSAENLANVERQKAYNASYTAAQLEAAKKQANQVGTSVTRGNGEKANSAPILYSGDKGYFYDLPNLDDWANSGPQVIETFVEDTITGGKNPVQIDAETSTTTTTTNTNKTKMAPTKMSFLSSLSPMAIIGGIVVIGGLIYYFIIKK